MLHRTFEYKHCNQQLNIILLVAVNWPKLQMLVEWYMLNALESSHSVIFMCMHEESCLCGVRARSINLTRFTFLDPGSLFLRKKSYWIHEGPSKSVSDSSCGGVRCLKNYPIYSKCIPKRHSFCITHVIIILSLNLISPHTGQTNRERFVTARSTTPQLALALPSRTISTPHSRNWCSLINRTL